MENAAAYTMLVLGGNAKPTADQVKAVVVAGGKAEPDEASIAALIKDMEGKELAAVIDAGMEKIKDVPMGGGGGGGGGAAAEEEKKEEEEEEEVDMGGGMDMFGDG